MFQQTVVTVFNADQPADTILGGRQSIKRRLKIRQRIAINKAARQVRPT
jgi:hypothetical protein